MRSIVALGVCTAFLTLAACTERPAVEVQSDRARVAGDVSNGDAGPATKPDAGHGHQGKENSTDCGDDKEEEDGGDDDYGEKDDDNEECSDDAGSAAHAGGKCGKGGKGGEGH